jgi:5,10-methylene-tetrahydrofolate dehydrogenase/methenyl tetrahydrofolate cyclohydrolase
VLIWVGRGAICINFSSEKNFDPSVKEKASIYVPAIGKVTITVLLRNILVSQLWDSIQKLILIYNSTETGGKPPWYQAG